MSGSTTPDNSNNKRPGRVKSKPKANLGASKAELVALCNAQQANIVSLAKALALFGGHQTRCITNILVGLEEAKCNCGWYGIKQQFVQLDSLARAKVAEDGTIYDAGPTEGVIAE